MARRIEGEVAWEAQKGSRRRAVFETFGSGASDRRYGALGVDLSEAVIALVCDVEVSCGIEGEAVREVEQGGLKRAVLVAGSSGSC